MQLIIRIGYLKMSKKLCPKCSSDNLAEFLYGMPSNDPELLDDIENKKIILGGCMEYHDSPQWHCNKCKYEWEPGEEKCEICLDVKMYCKCYEDVIKEAKEK